MAKEIYIDNGGNEIPICGVPLSASDLPIQAGSSTSTEEVIGKKATIVDLGRLDNTTKTITFSTAVRFLVFSFGGSDSRLGGYVCFGRASTSFAQPLLTSSAVTVTPNNNTIAITTSSSNVYVSLVIVYGSPDDFTVT